MSGQSFQAWLEAVLQNREHLLAIAVIWWAWRWHNNEVFGEEKCHMNHVLRHVLTDVSTWRECMESTTEERWLGLAHGSNSVDASAYHISTDGSWNSTSSRMGAAAVLRAPDGSWKAAIYESCEQGSAFNVELWVSSLVYD